MLDELIITMKSGRLRVRPDQDLLAGLKHRDHSCAANAAAERSAELFCQVRVVQ